MPVYLLLCSRKNKEKRTLFQYWIDAIKGEYDHVELIFIRNRECTGFWITIDSMYAKYDDRSLFNLTKLFHLEWMELRGISPERAGKIEERCRVLAQTNARKICTVKLMLSAFPFKDSFFLPRVLRIMEPTTPESVIYFHDTDVNENASFCSSLVGEVLGIENHHTLTIIDLVEICQERFDGQIVSKDATPAVQPMSTRTVRNPARIIRYDHSLV